uniref:FAF domain-containing protein n=1 Tax=Salix viminalis TaxID=40686 RepID=A0A6N2M0I3_SALVM
MEGNSSSTLKDMLKSPSPPKPVTPATWADPVFSKPPEKPPLLLVINFLTFLLTRVLLSSLINSFDAAFPYSSSSSSVKPVLITRKRRSSWFSGIQPEKMEFFPPPISSLELFNKGMRYSYLNYEEDDDTLVLEEIRIPHGDILRANRSGGRLRLAFVISDGESSDMEEEEEISENAG